MTRSALLITVVLAIIASAGLAAQTPSVAGVVRDSVGRPISSAEVSVGPLRTRTDSAGHFYLSFPRRDSVTVEIRRMGYERLRFSLSADEATGNELHVVLNALPFVLAEVKIDETDFRSMTPLAGFDERRARGAGVYITREDIARRNTILLTDVLRGKRGLIVTRSRDGRSVLRFALHQSKSCEPLIWIDGQKAPGLEIDAIPASDVEGIELYQTLASTPLPFIPMGSRIPCGTVVIWTKRPIVKP